MTFVDNRTPENDRSIHGKSHDGDYAEYAVDLRFAGLRRALLEQDVAAGVTGAAEHLAHEEAEAFDRSSLRDPFDPGFRWDDTGRPTPERVRWMVEELDGSLCRLCGDTEGPFEVDHIHPIALGGTDHMSNLWLLCRPCNRAKSGHLLADFLSTRKDLTPNLPTRLQLGGR